MKTQKFRKVSCFHQAFTLIELLVVIAIIAILMAVMVPALQRARTLAREVICGSHVRQIAIAALNYEQDYNRLPMHYTENNGEAEPEGPGSPLAAWPDMMANQWGHDARLVWERYISDMNFFNCPMVRAVDYNINEAPLNSARIYSGYQFMMGYMRDRGTDRQWGQRWNRTSQNWYYQGTRFNVLVTDRIYYSFALGHYRVNHGQNTTLTMAYSDYERSRDTGWIGSLYSQHGVFGDDLRLQMTSNYAFKDGSVAKLRGDNVRIVEVSTPSNQDTRAGTILLPSN